MAMPTATRQLFAQCKVHGSGGGQVMLSDSELYALFLMSVRDLDWDEAKFGFDSIAIPDVDYYKIPISWFTTLDLAAATPEALLAILDAACQHHRDYSLYVLNLSALHRRRVKYARILTGQPLPGIDQIAPRSLLEYGSCDIGLLANWMMWRKWVYDIDNRAGQETGYFFEPVLASCLGGESVGARNSPVKRLDSRGKATGEGRQIDCFVPSLKRVYELKMRVSIAASGQGRFSEELSFPRECAAAGFTPILLVIDPTPSNRLEELEKAFLDACGQCFKGQDAWRHMEDAAGEVVSAFIERYIKPPLQAFKDGYPDMPSSATLMWSKDEVVIEIAGSRYAIPRSTVVEPENEDGEV